MRAKRYYGKNDLHNVDPSDPSTFNVNPYPKGFSKVQVPEGISGAWEIHKFTVPEGIGTDLLNLRYIRDGRRDRVVPPGDYTKLSRNGSLVMTDTPAEANEHHDAYSEADGNVLIAGLGLGFVLQAILTKPTVRTVTVIEKEADVIKLTGPTITDPRVTIINADILTWQPPKDQSWNAAWFDIWDDICPDNKPEMRKLVNKFRQKAGWKGCWSANYL